jgi:PAS domain S-box-containing protein
VTRAWPIRRSLYLLVLATAAPLCLFIAYTLASAAKTSEREAEQLVLSLATNAAANVRTRLREIEHLAAALAQRPLVRLMDPAQCDPVLGALLPLMPRYANVSVIAPDGRFVCSALPPQAGREKVPIHGGIRGALAGHFAVSEPMMGVLPQRLVVSAAYPIERPGEGVVGVLTIPVDLAAVQPASDAPALPHDARVRVIDADGVLLASSIENDPELGHSVRGAQSVELLINGGSGAVRARGSDGVERIYGYAGVGAYGWKAYAGVPVAALLAAAHQRTVASALTAALLLFVSLGVAALVARHIVRAAHTIQHAMEETRAGRISHALETGPVELRTLAANYNRMLDATLRAREALHESEARLRLAIRASNTGLWDWHIRENRLYLSPEWKIQLGFEEHEMEDSFDAWVQRLHPGDRERVLAEEMALFASSRSQYEAEFRLRHKDGSYRWIYSRAEIIRDPDGSPRRMLGTHVDLTARKALEDELQRTVSELRVLSRRLIEVEETERRRIGRELHDRIGAHVAVLNITLGLAAEKLTGGSPDEAAALLDEAREVVRECSTDIRHVITELRPTALDDFGLYPAVLGYARTIAARVGAELRASGGAPELRAPPAVETALFRIAQEALTNIAKHANAKTISIALERRDDTLVLDIADDGTGFATTGAGGHGMRTMRERAEAIGATFGVSSAPGAGTRITVEVPLS